MVMKNESAQAFAACPPGPNGDAVWLVKTTSGVRTWSLDDLDAAFQRGEVDEKTFVFTSGMTEWTPLGVIANIDAPAANDTGDDRRDDAIEGTANAMGRMPTEPPRSRSVVTSAPLSDGGSFAPTSANVIGIGDGGASMWASITTPGPELQTGLRHHSAVLPFAVRRAVGGVLDGFAALRSEHPRWAVAGPWLVGAALSGVFIFSLYRLANAPVNTPLPGLSVASAASAAAATASATLDAPTPTAGASDATTSTTASATSRVDAAAGASDAAERPSGNRDVLRPNDLSFAPSRSERQLTRSSRAKTKATSGKRSAKKARARKRRRRSRGSSLD